MIFSKRASIRVQLTTASFIALAAIGIAFPGISSAQESFNEGLSKSEARTVLEDGTYLFGQSPNPNEVGSAYAVLSVEGDQAIGAFYQPHSSFDCFTAEVFPDRLAANVIDSYEQTAYPYAVAMTISDSLVAGGGAGAYTLEGFHRISDLSAQDHEILATCQADLAQ